MLQVTFEDELEVNAVFASLDDRLQKMSRQLATLREQRDSPSNAFAVECTQAAIRHTMRAKLQMLAAVEEPEYPADATVAKLGEWTPGELIAGWGK